MAEKLVVMVTHGPEEPELATIALVMAGAAVASDMDVVVGFQGEACRLVTKGVAEKIAVPEFVPLKKLLDDVHGLGGKFLVGGPCVKNRGIAPEDLIEGAEVCAAGRFVSEIASATNSLVY